MDSAYHNPGFSFLLLCCLCLKPSSFLQCLQQHPQQCGPHDAGLSFPPHCVAQGHPPPSGHGDERHLHPGRKHDCLGLSGGREDGVHSKTRVIHSGFPLVFLAGGLNPPLFFPPVQKGLGAILMFEHTPELYCLQCVHTAVLVTLPGPVKGRRLVEEGLPWLWLFLQCVCCGGTGTAGVSQGASLYSGV